MSITPTEPVGSPTLAGLVSTQASAGPSEDKQMFLELLVAQMRYQDPMNPTDSGEFLAQSAQFTALEKMQEVADQMGLLLNAQLAFGATGMLGSSVEYLGLDGDPATGVVRGVSYTADGPVLNVDGTSVPLGSVVSVGEKAATDVEPSGGTDSNPGTDATDPTQPTA